MAEIFLSETFLIKMINSLPLKIYILFIIFFTVFPYPALILPAVIPESFFNFTLVQISIILITPFFLKNIDFKDILIITTILAYFLLTLIFHNSPNFSVLHLILPLIVKEFWNIRDLKYFNKMLFYFILFSIFISFISGPGRLVFFGGDPNYTALIMSLWLCVNYYLHRRMDIASVIIILIIIGTFSRTGSVFLLLAGLLNLVNIRKMSSFLMIIIQIFSVFFSLLLVQIVYDGQMPSYQEYAGITRLNLFESAADVSNYIRFSANSFMFNEEFQDVLIWGSPNTNLVAFEFINKYIKPHNFFSSMVFEHGIIVGIIILFRLLAINFSNIFVISFFISYGYLLGFGVYTALIFLLLISCSKIKIDEK